MQNHLIKTWKYNKMIRPFSELLYFFKRETVVGSFIDTTVLFSATYPLDSFNAESELAFESMASAEVVPFTNVNVRAEFLENHRRILIAECLIDFLEDFKSKLDGALFEKLKAHRTSFRRKVVEEKSNKIDVGQIKVFRNLLASFKSPVGNGWDLFCRDYLMDRLVPIWPEAKNEFGLNFISIRSDSENDFMTSSPSWEKAVSLMGRYGMASSDAMILNMFLCSKISVLLTSDLEMAEVANKEAGERKNIFVPDSAFIKCVN